jgi:hypothetical protein
MLLHLLLLGPRVLLLGLPAPATVSARESMCMGLAPAAWEKEREHSAHTPVLTRLHMLHHGGPRLAVQGAWFCVRCMLARSGALHARI